jgi:transposase
VKLARRSPAKPTPEDGAESRSTAELVAERDRLTERFALLQSELGGLFYEMAIRDHVQMDVLIAKAAALQRLDSELAQLELLRGGNGAIGGQCPNCGATFARGAAFCSQCATSLAQV